MNKVYKATLEVEFHVPDYDPSRQMTPIEIKESILQTKGSAFGYAVCPNVAANKVTTSMKVTAVTFEHVCEHCGSAVDKGSTK